MREEAVALVELDGMTSGAQGSPRPGLGADPPESRAAAESERSAEALSDAVFPG